MLILLVDDQAAVRESFAAAATLVDPSVRILTACNGEAAIEALRNGSLPDALLLDLWMPVMNGWQMLVAMGRDGSIPRVPIVIFSVYSEIPIDVPQHLISGGVDKIQAIEEILETLRTIITQKGAVAS